MAEPTERRSNRSRKPKVHFDDQIAQSGPSELSIASNVPAKPIKPAPKSTKKPTPTKSIAKPKAKLIAKPIKSTASTKSSTTKPIDLDLVQELCS